jgi:hypothetical protein
VGVLTKNILNKLAPMGSRSLMLPTRLVVRDVFGEDKLSVRSVFGVAGLPLGVPVMLEVTFKGNN